MEEALQTLSEVDLGSVLLSIAVAIGFILISVLIFRIFEIAIRIYLDKRRSKAEEVKKLIKEEAQIGF